MIVICKNNLYNLFTVGKTYDIIESTSGYQVLSDNNVVWSLNNKELDHWFESIKYQRKRKLNRICLE